MGPCVFPLVPQILSSQPPGAGVCPRNCPRSGPVSCRLRVSCCFRERGNPDALQGRGSGLLSQAGAGKSRLQGPVLRGAEFPGVRREEVEAAGSALENQAQLPLFPWGAPPCLQETPHVLWVLHRPALPGGGQALTHPTSLGVLSPSPGPKGAQQPGHGVGLAPGGESGAALKATHVPVSLSWPYADSAAETGAPWGRALRSTRRCGLGPSEFPAYIQREDPFPILRSGSGGRERGRGRPWQRRGHFAVSGS